MNLELPADDASVLARAEKSLRLATASLPHLSGLARRVRLKVSSVVPVAGIGRSGLLLLNPTVFAQIPLGDAAFVLAHELLHLALDTHGRQGDANPLVTNFAHDYIINDMLLEELERDPPLGGLRWPGARETSLEELIVQLSRGSGGSELRCWSPLARVKRPQPAPPTPRSSLSKALEEAGLVEPPPPRVAPPLPPRITRGDVLPDDEEDALEPEVSRQAREQLRVELRKEAAKAASLSELRRKIDQAGLSTGYSEPQRGTATMEALRAAYETPWELALQRWFDAVGPGQRTYARPSRRGGGRTDVVLPGRRRDGWTLHILLDTSGSMVEVLPKALGAIAWFCEATGVAEVHLLQCDEEVTGDRWIQPDEMTDYEITGFGGSDMTPGIIHLSNNPEVEAALVLTDGAIDYPAEKPPFAVLWCLLGECAYNFSPPYGQVVRMPLD